MTIDVFVSESVLSLMEWHSLIVSVSNESVWFFVDGELLAERELTGAVNDRVEGVLTVGGLTHSMFYEGFLQDVRIYCSSSLQQE